MAASMRMSYFRRLTHDISYTIINKGNLKRPPTPINIVSPVRLFSSKYTNIVNKNNKLFTKTFVISASVGTLAYVGNLFHNTFGVKADTGGRPNHTPIRKIRNEQDSSGLKLTLYQYQSCPFCCKARAYLDYYGFSYDVVEVNSFTRKELKWTKYPKVPVLVCDGIGQDGFVQINDSSVIISLLDSYLEDRSVGVDKLITYYPAVESKGKRGKTKYEYPNKHFIMYGEKQNLKKTTKQMAEERKWRKWVDDWLVHTLSPNVYRTRKEAIQSFNYFSEVGEWEKVFSKYERAVIINLGAVVMYILGKHLKKKYSLTSDVRISLYEACDEWIEAIGKDRKFMGGKQPNLADLSVYGVLSSIEGCDAFKDVLKNTNISTWFYNMKDSVNSHAGAGLNTNR